jgi:hypothetical protein
LSTTPLLREKKLEIFQQKVAIRTKQTIKLSSIYYNTRDQGYKKNECVYVCELFIHPIFRYCQSHQEPCSSTGWYILVFPMETSRIQIPPSTTIELSKKKKRYFQSHAGASKGKSTGKPKIQYKPAIRLVRLEIRMLQTIKTTLIFLPQLITAPCRVIYAPLGFYFL